MPEFVLNKPRESAYDKLDTFAKGYVEAMFFTNCDCGDEDEDKANNLGVSRLTKESIAVIERDCAAFWKSNEIYLQIAMELEPGSDIFRYATETLDEARLGHLFWYSRQGHGVAFTDDGDATCLEALQDAGRAFGESNVEIYRGWIYVR